MIRRVCRALEQFCDVADCVVHSGVCRDTAQAFGALDCILDCVPMLPHEWSTRRLSLRPARAEDAKAIFQGRATEATVTRYLSWRPHRRLEETREFVERCVGLARDHPRSMAHHALRRAPADWHDRATRHRSQRRAWVCPGAARLGPGHHDRGRADRHTHDTPRSPRRTSRCRVRRGEYGVSARTRKGRPGARRALATLHRASEPER